MRNADAGATRCQPAAFTCHCRRIPPPRNQIRLPAACPPRAASTRNRTTSRKRCEAARAADAARAPQDLPTPPKPRKKRQANHPPRRPSCFHTASPVWLRCPVRGASISPTESEGIAVGDDEDEAGEVRSEGAGPQSWPRAPGAVAAPGVKRTQIPASPEPTKKRDRDASLRPLHYCNCNY